MNNETDLVQLRLHAGQLQMRQRQLEQGYMPQYVTADYPPWGDWMFIPAVKGDESDRRFE